MRKAYWLFLFPLFLVLTIPPVYAEDVNILDVPQKVGESLGIPEPNTAFIGGLLMSCFFYLGLVMPTLLLRNKAPAMVMSFLCLGTLTALGWLPGWIMVMVLLLVTGAMAQRIKRWFS